MNLSVFVVSIAACFAAHEGGHYLAALCFGERIRFRFAWGKLGPVSVPRYLWEMPYMDRWKEKVVAGAGFYAEGLVALILAVGGWPWMYFCFAVHFAAYPLYAGEASDFKWFRR